MQRELIKSYRGFQDRDGPALWVELVDGKLVVFNRPAMAIRLNWEALDFVGGLQGLDFIGFDLVEVLPAYDPTEITAALEATIMQGFISLIVLKRS